MKKRVLSDSLVTKKILIGPTASGKTRWALEYLQDSDVDVISVDSNQVYVELNVGSAKVTAEECRHLPHYLIDRVSVQDTYDVAQYLHDAQNAQKHIQKHGRKALFLGGSMLYADKLMHGLSEVPSVPKSLWHTLAAQCTSQGTEYLWQQLLTLDPSYSERLHPHDKQRIIRALAVILHTGKPLYSYWGTPENHTPYQLAMIYPLSKASMMPMVEKRTQHMLATGIIEETQRWFDGSSEPVYQGLRSVGYRETWAYLRGDISNIQALQEAIVRSTMRYIKQQMTWMKKWMSQANLVVDIHHDGQELFAWWNKDV